MFHGRAVLDAAVARPGITYPTGRPASHSPRRLRKRMYFLCPSSFCRRASGPRVWGGGGQIAWPACGTPAWLRPRGSAWVTAGGSGQRRSVARPDNQWGGRPAKRPPHLAASAQPRHGDKRLSLVIKQKMMSESLACGDVTGSCEGPELMVAFAWTVINLHVSRHRSAVVSAATPTSGFYSASGPQQPSAGT